MHILEEKLSQFGSIPGLERIEKLLNHWGNPQNQSDRKSVTSCRERHNVHEHDRNRSTISTSQIGSEHQTQFVNKLKVIIVTGTNGKGSVTTYLASILKEAGYKTGSYFSPHLKKYNERIKINGKKISDSDLEEYSQEVIEYINQGNTITLFEALTAIAYRYFAENNVEYAVMEVGMGGRFDAVNIAKEEIAVITNIGLEHTEHLGETEEKIAFEKAGIIKKGIAITGVEGKALEVIKKEAERGKGLRVLGEDFKIENIIASDKETIFDYSGKKSYKKLKIRLLGSYQAKNAALAIKAAEEIGIEEYGIRKGLENANIRGRMEIIGTAPTILIDGAHNPHGINALVENLKLFKYERLILVFGVMKNKNWKEMLTKISKNASIIVLNKTKNEKERVLDPEEIRRFLEENRFSGKIKVIPDVKKSLAYAKTLANETDLILVCGSIYMISELV